MAVKVMFCSVAHTFKFVRNGEVEKFFIEEGNEIIIGNGEIPHQKKSGSLKQ